MKTKIYKNTSILVTAFCLLLLLCSQQSQAQKVIYDQTFNAAYPNWPSGWSSSSPNGWVMDTNSTNQSYVWNSSSMSGYSWASGGAMVEISPPVDGDTATYTLTSTGISTIGFTNITATFGARITKHFQDSGSVIKYFEWTNYSGGAWNAIWTNIPFIQNDSNSNWYVINDSMLMALPAGAAGQDSIRFRWVTYIAPTPSGTYRFDDFIVAGDSVATGIKTLNVSSLLSLFPNPASNFVEINNPAGKDYAVRLTDVTGKTLKTAYISNTENRINVSDIAPGFYMAQLISSDNDVEQQVIKLVIIR